MSKPEYRLTQNGGKFAVTFDVAGRTRPVRVSTGTSDRGLAELRAAEIWRIRTRPKSGRVADLWPNYLTDRLKEVAAPDKMKYAWKALEPFFGYKAATAITKDDCRAYHASRKRQGRADSTIRTELEILRACLNFHNVPNTLWMPPASKPRDSWLTRDDVTKLFEHLDAPHLRLFMTIALTTGARMSAILDLTWDRVDFETGIIDFMPAGRHKTNKVRGIVPMNTRVRESLQEAFTARLSDSVIEYGGKAIKDVGWSFKRLSQRSGVKCSPHMFRHTAGVWMAQDDIPMSQIAQFLHTTVVIAEKHYARFSPSFMRKQAESLDW